MGGGEFDRGPVRLVGRTHRTAHAGFAGHLDMAAEHMVTVRMCVQHP